MEAKLGKIELAIIFIPLGVFVGFLAMSYTVTKAAFWATIIGVVTTAICYFIQKEADAVKKTGKLCMDVCIDGAGSILSMAGLLAGAQISIALISQTGFGVKLSSLIVSIGQGHLFPCLVLSMVVCFILGMGLPPTAAYVLAASILAPALITLGLPDLVAHLFVFYFSTIGAITLRYVRQYSWHPVLRILTGLRQVSYPCCLQFRLSWFHLLSRMIRL